MGITIIAFHNFFKLIEIIYHSEVISKYVMLTFCIL